MSAMVAVTCPRCERVIALHEGRPVVEPSGVRLWHARCHEQRDVPYVAPVVDVAPIEVTAPAPAPMLVVELPKVGAPHSLGSVPRSTGLEERSIPRFNLSAWLRRRKREKTKKAIGSSIGASTATAAIALVISTVVASPQIGFAAFDVDHAETITLPEADAKHELPPGQLAWVPTATELRYPMTHAPDGTAYDDKYPSLRSWVHPVTHSAEYVPQQKSRLFGVERVGIERAECGEGHCGIDLDGPRGRSLVAVADGIAVRIERSENGIDQRSGRYVRIRHADGTYTGYMHMDDIADGLTVGDPIKAGQYIGTLGATAVYSAPPHLHFQLEIPMRSVDGDSTETTFIDPAPFLARSRIVELPSELDDVIDKEAKKPRRDKRPIAPPS